MSVWAVMQDENMPQEAVGPRGSSKAHFRSALDLRDDAVRSRPHPMSDLQHMMENERKQHETFYIYANGHNDHGLGQ